ncbi:MAG: cysteine--tRNA ligase [Candidatus Azambacteria bacterium]|nr:cysteine--tRNA ligase [Candidatus Azambacteria bacterium]
MAVKLYNQLSKKIDTFKPLRPHQVGFYACGPTVYNYAHIGNLRTYIFEDILKRTLEYNGYKVNLVMNITDVEDKIIREAEKAGKSLADFVKPYEKAFFEDLKKLNIKKASQYPKATRHIKEMINIILVLLKKSLAYESAGSIYFDISKFKKYGKLSGLSARGGSAFGGKNRSRIDADEYDKTNANDFVLWKKAKAGEPSWKAPFGAGRPGWHIECSAMSMKYLGDSFDIHAGAVDLIFPHHENEIAQSEGATGKSFAKYFIEGEHLLVDGAKMSKSLGNIYNLRDLESKKFDPLAFRYLALTAHYRSKLNFSWKSLESAQNALNNLSDLIVNLKDRSRSDVLIHNNKKIIEQFRKKFLDHINNDLETPSAIALLWEVVKSEKLSPKAKYSLIIEFDKVLGLELAKVKAQKIPSAILKLAKDREKYRQEKNFAKSDELRKKIESLGWLIDDSPSGPKLKQSED